MVIRRNAKDDGHNLHCEKCGAYVVTILGLARAIQIDKDHKCVDQWDPVSNTWGEGA